ncbi:ribonuclease inhibitor-like [Branchiostoma lanceolatum]|uniref:ribonuclease inhibitor-like n=1 Tax=Branchiostoma lanceolatum TaxID=7740 RepID=UPI0034543175
MQEFLAGRYVAHAVLDQDITELLQLTFIDKAHELRNLLLFTCGCDSQAADAVMEELCTLSSQTFQHIQPNVLIRKLLDRYEDVMFHYTEHAATYGGFLRLCLDLRKERNTPDVLQTVSRALPVIILDIDERREQLAGLECYIEDIKASQVPIATRMILILRKCKNFQDLEQIFASTVPGLRLDLKLLNGVEFSSTDQTVRLVSVLKNVPHLRSLILSGTELTPSSLQPLVQGFSHVSMLEELHITENKELGDSGMEVLQVGLSSVPHLTVLRLRMVGMTSVGMSSMVPYMRHLVRLRELDVSDNKIGDSGLESLNTILPIFTAMQVLALGFNKITTTAMRTLVRTLRHLTGLIKLDISGNAIGDPGLECLAAILHHLTAMKVLVLMSTGISDRGISALIKALPYLVQLEVLDVCWNVIEDAGLISLVETICSLVREGNSTLQVLSIGRNIPVTEAGLERIAQLTSTLPSLTTLTRYDRSDRNWDIHEFLSDTAAMSLAEALPKLPHLLMMELTFKAFDMHPAMFRQDVVQDAEEHSTLEALA